MFMDFFWWPEFLYFKSLTPVGASFSWKRFEIATISVEQQLVCFDRRWSLLEVIAVLWRVLFGFYSTRKIFVKFLIECTLPNGRKSLWMYLKIFLQHLSSYFFVQIYLISKSHVFRLQRFKNFQKRYLFQQLYYFPTLKLYIKI